MLGDPAEQGGGGGGGDAELQVHPSDIYVSPPLSSCSSFKNIPTRRLVRQLPDMSMIFS